MQEVHGVVVAQGVMQKELLWYFPCSVIYDIDGMKKGNCSCVW